MRGGKRTRSKQERVKFCTSLAQAQKARAVKISELFTGQFRDVERDITLHEFLSTFLASRRGKRTVKKYEQQITQRFSKWMGRALASIERDEVIAWYHSRLESVAVSTANNEISAIRALLNEAKHRRIIRTNPVERIQLKAPNNERDRILSDKEALGLEAQARERNDFMRPLYFVLYSTGCRLSEALKLEWKNIDMKTLWIRFHDAKSGSMRRVPLAESAARHLRWWRKQCRGKLVFPNPQRTAPLVQIGKSWRSLCRAAKVANLRRHDLRHNFVSQLQMQGVGDSIIAELSGHRTLTSLRRYSHSRDEAKVAAVALMLKSSHRAVA